MVLCAAKTEQSEPGVARAEGIAHKIIQHKTRPKGMRPNNPNKKILNVITPKLIQTTKSRAKGIAHKIIPPKNSSIKKTPQKNNTQ